MLSEYIKITEFNQYHKSDKTPFIIYADPKSLIEKFDGCKNNTDKPFKTRAGRHIPLGFSMPTISSFKDRK